MKKLIRSILLLLLFSFTFYHAQVPRFVKYNVADSGTSLYLPGEPKWETSVSEDKSTIYTTEVNFNNVTYGALVVKLFNPADNIEPVLENYLQYLNMNFFQLTKTTDIGKGHTMEKYPDVKGILEYGENAEGESYTIKCWGNKSYLSVLYIRSKEEVNYNFQEMYFNGFRFP
ncbi:hypothetical protein HNP38_001495 [Chryseobacterium defluvii]|uniref:PsbP protein n=1 Tax=Chryseobacterium defluvii TaxID=160396 RepID=A0A840KFC6_9FLAO|nr:hypothetical protein [Chryseobacterium defluvii]MBB4806223.1 hypothetical protein [Chryseobacterium defluvii]